MRITIEIPDDQVPAAYRSDLYPSGYEEDNLYDLMINAAIINRLWIGMGVIKSIDCVEKRKEYEDLISKDIDFLRLLQSHMKIDAGV